MTIRKTLAGVCVGLLSTILVTPAGAQAARGKAELKAGSGMITVDFGQPSLKGRDMLSRLEEGTFWRMGMNEATVLTTPVDLMFGTTKIAKGAYSLWLKKAGESFELVFNSQTGQWGTQHDPSKDVSSVAMKATSLESPVETFVIDLTSAPKGGSLGLSWGDTHLAAAFEAGK
jgi:hypothetical protein